MKNALGVNLIEDWAIDNLRPYLDNYTSKRNDIILFDNIIQSVIELNNTNNNFEKIDTKNNIYFTQDAKDKTISLYSTISKKINHELAKSIVYDTLLYGMSILTKLDYIKDKSIFSEEYKLKLFYDLLIFYTFDNNNPLIIDIIYRIEDIIYAIKTDKYINLKNVYDEKIAKNSLLITEMVSKYNQIDTVSIEIG